MSIAHEPEQIVLQREEHAYGFIIEVLTRGLYPNKLHVIREYVRIPTKSSTSSGHVVHQ